MYKKRLAAEIMLVVATKAPRKNYVQVVSTVVVAVDCFDSRGIESVGVFVHFFSFARHLSTHVEFMEPSPGIRNPILNVPRGIFIVALSPRNGEVGKMLARSSKRKGISRSRSSIFVLALAVVVIRIILEKRISASTKTVDLHGLQIRDGSQEGIQKGIGSNYDSGIISIVV